MCTGTCEKVTYGFTYANLNSTLVRSTDMVGTAIDSQICPEGKDLEGQIKEQIEASFSPSETPCSAGCFCNLGKPAPDGDPVTYEIDMEFTVLSRAGQPMGKCTFGVTGQVNVQTLVAKGRCMLALDTFKKPSSAQPPKAVEPPKKEDPPKAVEPPKKADPPKTEEPPKKADPPKKE
jgi:hypothetical protein